MHHHLRPGGVTRVITEEIRSLSGVCNPLVICGEPPEGEIPLPFRVVPSIAYDRDRVDSLRPEETVRLIREEVRSFFNGEADLYHIHNPTLGKNRDFLQVVEHLVDGGARVLLHIHDFAEDGRPSNYSPEEYPEDCHYAVLNRRDHAILKEAGLKDEGLHLIPNPVSHLPTSGFKGGLRRLVLYPVRAIRRKNIGEALLLSLFFRDDEMAGVTLEPTSSIDVLSYRGWIDFVREKRLRVQFKLGVEKRYEDVLAKTRCFITTSIKEGFGFSFLEPWTASIPVYGRALRDICSDFTQKGVELAHLYDRIAIPFDLIDEVRFCRKWKSCYAEKMRCYGMPQGDDEIDGIFAKIFNERVVDFGMLSEDLQQRVIEGMLCSEELRRSVVAVNPFLEEATSSAISSDVIEGNRSVVEEHYSLERIGELLLEVYAKVMSTSPLHRIDKSTLIRLFNSPERNHLLLCDASYGA